VLEEIGRRPAACAAKSVDEFRQLPLTYLIAVCGKADQACPTALLSPKHRLFWPFDDPAAAQGSQEARLAEFRRVRNEIEAQIKIWLASPPQVG
jgi:arsenate reductase